MTGVDGCLQRAPACTKENCSWPRPLIQHRYLLSPKQLTARGPNPHHDDRRLVNAVSGAESRSAYAVGGRALDFDATLPNPGPPTQPDAGSPAETGDHRYQTEAGPPAIAGVVARLDLRAPAGNSRS